MDHTEIAEICNNNTFVEITFRKVNGEVTTRRTSFSEIPEEFQSKGVRESKEGVLKFFDLGKMGWISAKLENIISVVPVK